jgi:hypothetical protein
VRTTYAAANPAAARTTLAAVRAFASVIAPSQLRRELPGLEGPLELLGPLEEPNELDELDELDEGVLLLVDGWPETVSAASRT